MSIRYTKLKQAFEKSIDQIFQETGITSSGTKEELLSSFQQILLKYSIPSKLDDLDQRISKTSPPYDITSEESISQIMQSYIQEEAFSLLQQMKTQEETYSTAIREKEEEEQEYDEKIKESLKEINKWIEESSQSVSQIKKYIE